MFVLRLIFVVPKRVWVGGGNVILFDLFIYNNLGAYKLYNNNLLYEVDTTE